MAPYAAPILLISSMGFGSAGMPARGNHWHIALSGAGQAPDRSRHPSAARTISQNPTKPRQPKTACATASQKTVVATAATEERVNWLEARPWPVRNWTAIR